MMIKVDFYTYAYLRVDGTPYYIGKGSNGRAYDKGKGEVRPPKDRSRVIFLKRNLTEEEAFKHEIYMIAVFGRIDLGTGILRNRTNGGEGTSGAVRSEETKRKIRKSVSESYNPNRLSYNITTPEGDTILVNGLYNFAMEHNLSPVTLHRVAKGKINQHKGYKVSYVDEERRIEAENFRESREDAKVSYMHPATKTYIGISPEGTQYVFTGAGKFAKEHGLKRGGIFLVANGKQTHHRGWKFRLKDK